MRNDFHSEANTLLASHIIFCKTDGMSASLAGIRCPPLPNSLYCITQHSNKLIPRPAGVSPLFPEAADGLHGVAHGLLVVGHVWHGSGAHGALSAVPPSPRAQPTAVLKRGLHGACRRRRRREGGGAQVRRNEVEVFLILTTVWRIW